MPGHPPSRQLRTPVPAVPSNASSYRGAPKRSRESSELPPATPARHPSPGSLRPAEQTAPPQPCDLRRAASPLPDHLPEQHYPARPPQEPPPPPPPTSH